MAAEGLRELIVLHTPQHKLAKRWETLYYALTGSRGPQNPSESDDLVQRMRQSLITVASQGALHEQNRQTLIQMAQQDPDFAAQLLMVRTDLSLQEIIAAARQSTTWDEWKSALSKLRPDLPWFAENERR